jgi:hypothetical protein
VLEKTRKPLPFSKTVAPFGAGRQGVPRQPAGLTGRPRALLLARRSGYLTDSEVDRANLGVDGELPPA